jgi:hypothetical protein
MPALRVMIIDSWLPATLSSNPALSDAHGTGTHPDPSFSMRSRVIGITLDGDLTAAE